MTLSTHIVTGAAVARIFANNPVTAFVLGWATHYILDSITHWDYKLDNYTGDRVTGLNTKLVLDKATLFDVGKVLLDILLGFSVILFISVPSVGITNILLLILVGAIGGAFPDFLQFLYAIFKKSEILNILQKFHFFVHAKDSLDDRPWIGVSMQILIIMAMGYFLIIPL